MLQYIIAGAIGFVVAKLFEDDETPKYADGGSVLLAPNGKPSNLTPQQYKLVRSQAFKQWFGDWENSPETASKVVDENGEPKVVGRMDYQRKYKYADEYPIFFCEKEDVKYFTEFGENEIYVFLNIKNPITIQFGQSWDNIPYDELIKVFSTKDLINMINYEWNDNYKSWDEYLNSIDDFEPFLFSTDIISNYVKNKGINDGIIIYDIDETSNHEVNTNDYIVFNSNQIKLADGTNTTFDGSNPDIRYAGGGEIEFVIEQVKLEVDLSYYKQNIQYHSLYPKLKNLNFFDDDEKVTSILVKGFINDVKAKSELVNGKIRLYRALAIKNVEKLNVEKLGIYWSVNEDKTGVFDDEGYEHKEKPNYKSVFIIRAEFNTKDIDWQNSFDLYVMNDWMEGEIRVVDGSEAYNLKIKKSGDKKWLNI